MSVRDDSGLDQHGGWFTAALVFAVGLMAAALLLSMDWHRTTESDALALGASNTRPLVILPLHLK
ncbi:hypothetical protein [Azospirillum sp.]|uniref:hypothetical protein n=1 Tax=Azospirillum sp. TaxID=34012 RepID=UPI003D715996